MRDQGARLSPRMPGATRLALPPGALDRGQLGKERIVGSSCEIGVALIELFAWMTESIF